MGPSLPCPAELFRKESLGQRDPDTQQGLTHNTASWTEPGTHRGCRLGLPSILRPAHRLARAEFMPLITAKLPRPRTALGTNRHQRQNENPMAPCLLRRAEAAKRAPTSAPRHARLVCSMSPRVEQAANLVKPVGLLDIWLLSKSRDANPSTNRLVFLSSAQISGHLPQASSQPSSRSENR